MFLAKYPLGYAQTVRFHHMCTFLMMYTYIHAMIPAIPSSCCARTHARVTIVFRRIRSLSVSCYTMGEKEEKVPATG